MRKEQVFSTGACFGKAVMVVLMLGVSGLSDSRGTRQDTHRENHEEVALEDALRMVRASQDRLAPVYGPLAEHLVTELRLKEQGGLGIDIGSGPGTLILELCKRTDMHWINADVNPFFFSTFMRQVNESNFTGRVSAMRADVHALPFRDNLADVIVSRGSFWLWRDKVQAFGEILRVLKPEGVAYIGRGFSENLPLETARRIRTGAGRKLQYDMDDTIAELKQIMLDLKIQDYTLVRPHSHTHGAVNYGVWIKFSK